MSSTLKSIFWIVAICFIIYLTYFVWQTYIWMLGIMDPAADAPSGDPSQLKDYIREINGLAKRLFDWFDTS